VIIPTAGDNDKYDASEASKSFLAKAGVKNLTVLHTRDRKIADTKEFAAPIKNARAVWFEGGRQWRLVDSYLGTQTEKELYALLERGGVIGGSSAGATIQGSYLVRGAREGNTVMMAEGYEQGLGFLRGVAVDQHLLKRKRENDMLQVIAAHPGLLGIGLDESTAIVVKGDQFEVIGDSKAAIYDNGKKFYYLSPGDRFDIKTRRKLDPAPRAHWTFPSNRLLDLTYAYDDKTLFWPTAKPFQWEKDAWGPSVAGYWYASASFTLSEHGGTHLDSPIHFGEGKMANDDLPLSKLVSPAVVVDISGSCETNPDYRLTADDLAAWEKRFDKIPAGSIVLVRTGWGRRWPDRKKYLGSEKVGDASDLHFPGISEEAAKLLVDRKVNAVGIDTASLDYGPSKDFIAHRVLNGANIFGLENIAHLELVPFTGTTLIALPMKIHGGTGGPVRIMAVLP
jgi:cyanophycinase